MTQALKHITLYCFITLLISSCCNNVRCDCEGDYVWLQFNSGHDTTVPMQVVAYRYVTTISSTKLQDTIALQPQFTFPGDTVMSIDIDYWVENQNGTANFVITFDSLYNAIYIDQIVLERIEGTGCCKCPRNVLKSFRVNTSHIYPSNGLFQLQKK